MLQCEALGWLRLCYKSTDMFDQKGVDAMKVGKRDLDVVATSWLVD